MNKLIISQVVICWALLGCVSSGDSQQRTNNGATKLPTKQSFGEIHPQAPEELRQFGRFAGRWQCAVSERRADGSWKPRASEVIWTWFYTLSGRAVQDIWTPQTSPGEAPVVATNLRLFNSVTSSWNVSWTNTQQASFELWSGGLNGDEIIMTSLRDQRPVKIRFFNITPRQFQWSYEAAASLQALKFDPVLQMQCRLLD